MLVKRVLLLVEHQGDVGAKGWYPTGLSSIQVVVKIHKTPYLPFVVRIDLGDGKGHDLSPLKNEDFKLSATDRAPNAAHGRYGQQRPGCA